MLSPRFKSERHRFPALIVRRTSPSRGSKSTTLPMAAIIPVNIKLCPNYYLKAGKIHSYCKSAINTYDTLSNPYRDTWLLLNPLQFDGCL